MSLKDVSFEELRTSEKSPRPQLCRVSIGVAKEYGLSLGQCVRFKTHDKSVICKVFFNIYAMPSIQYDSYVTENIDGACLKLTDRKKVDIYRLKCQDAKEVFVKLVLKNTSHHKTLRLSDQIQKELAIKCVRCMRNTVITPGCLIDLSQSRLAKLYGIFCCLVQSCSSEAGQPDSFSAVKIVEKTDFKISGVQSWDCYQLLKDSSLGATKDIIAGLQKERQILAELLASPRNFSASHGVLLGGPPGCGKTSLVRQVAYDCSAALVTFNSIELISSSPGESESKLVALFDKAVRVSQEVPCILFIDDVDAICPKRGNSGATNSSRMTTALLTQLDKVACVSGLLIVVATNRPSALDPDIRHPGRLGREILLFVPTSTQRRQILQLHLSNLPVAHDLDLDWLSSITSGYVGADLELVCTVALRNACHRHLLAGLSVKDMDYKITKADMMSTLLTVRPSMQRGVESVTDTCSVLWSDIGGLDDVKLNIQKAIEWPMLHPETFQALGLPLTKGVLLYGPPGCGKTTLIQAAATASQVTFLSMSCADLYSMFVGESEQKISEIFQKARALAPTILFLDEIDSIVGKRSESSTSSQASERVLSTLLNEIDGVGIRLDEKTNGKMSVKREAEGDSCISKVHYSGQTVTEAHDSHVLVVAATNQPNMLDAALLRPGRLDRLIFVPPPDVKGRLQAFNIHTKKMPLAKDVDLTQLAEQTKGYTGADIRGVCQEAGLQALSESFTAKVVYQIHFDRALRDCKPSLPVETSEVEAMFCRLWNSPRI